MKNFNSVLPGMLICIWLAFTLSSCTTIYLVRHAEKQDSSYDTHLSDLGLQRASDLKNTLWNKGIDSIFVSTFIRTQETAKPLCNALKKDYVIYDINNSEQLAKDLKLLKRKDILVVGHSTNIPQMVKVIANKSVNIPENVYNKMFIIKIYPWNKINFKETTYGAPSPSTP